MLLLERHFLKIFTLLQSNVRSRFVPKPRDDLTACNNCGRNFAEDRIEKHQEICIKTSKKKRKTFDMTKKRVQGTEAETFVMKPKRGTRVSIIFFFKTLKEDIKKFTFLLFIHKKRESPRQLVEHLLDFFLLSFIPLSPALALSMPLLSSPWSLFLWYHRLVVINAIPGVWCKMGSRYIFHQEREELDFPLS